MFSDPGPPLLHVAGSCRHQGGICVIQKLELKQLRKQFNEASDSVRLVTLLSPT